MRKKRRRYKLISPVAVVEQPPARVVAIATIFQWAVSFFLAGVLAAFLLISSLFTHLHLGERVWLDFWPSSLRLMTATGLSPHQMTHLAFWMAGENGLEYGMIGVVLGGIHVGLRSLRKSWRRSAV